MEFNEYSAQAEKTNSLSIPKENQLTLFVLGLNEESGEVARLLKKSLRNDIAATSLTADLRRKLGDVLWYLNAVCGAVGLSLEDVARTNLQLVDQRWADDSIGLLSPEREPLSREYERFPDSLIFEFKREENEGIVQMRLLLRNNETVGDVVDDNERTEDGYRFHDVLHLALMAHFGWSPVFRKLLKLKRKSDPMVDRVEDGAKARDVEESIVRQIFIYIQDHKYLEGFSSLDTSFLATLRSSCRGREPHHVTERKWELMILDAAYVIRQLIRDREGFVIVDNVARKLTYRQALNASG